MDSDLKPLFQKIPIFAGLAEDVIEGFAAAGRKQRVEAGVTLVDQGSPGREMFVVLEGEVEVIKRLPSSNEVKLAQLGKGDFFGEMCIIQCMPRSATVRTVKPCLLLGLTNAEIHKLFHNAPDQFSILILNIARDLCRRMQKLQELLDVHGLETEDLHKSGGAI